MSVLRSRFVQAVVILVGAFVVLRFGIRPPAPWSVIQIYMTIVFLAVLIYVSADTDSWRSFVDPIRVTLVDPSKRPLRSEERRVGKECRARWSACPSNKKIKRKNNSVG